LRRLFPTDRFGVSDTPFGIRSSWEGDTAIIVVRGEIDLSTAPEMKTAVEAIPEAAQRVVIDLSESTFLDSAGIDTLLRCRRELDRRGIELRVVSPTDGIVRKALEITNILPRLGVVDSLDEALA
jgi:anti-anti-sigma factor